MLTPKEATEIVITNLPKGSIQCYVEYKELFLFQVFGDDPLEGQWDPYYSVNRHTGEFRDFSVITDGNPTEILGLFTEAKKGRKP